VASISLPQHFWEIKIAESRYRNNSVAIFSQAVHGAKEGAKNIVQILKISGQKIDYKSIKEKGARRGRKYSKM
jgi:hypothetical protein